MSPLPQDIVDVILDAVAYTSDSDEFPAIPRADIVSCSLVCRKWLARSSYHLLRRLHFEVPGYEPIAEDGEKVTERVMRLLKASRTSCRLMSYINGLSIEWSVGMPPLVTLIDEIKRSLPRLSVLRMYHGPISGINPFPVPLRNNQYNIKTLDIGMYDPASEDPVQRWLFEFLRLFSRIEHLRLVCLDEIDKDKIIQKSPHLHVHHVELQQTDFDVLQALRMVAIPSSVAILTINHLGSWTPDRGHIHALDKFVEACSESLTEFSFESASAPTKPRTDSEWLLRSLATSQSLKFSQDPLD